MQWDVKGDTTFGPFEPSPATREEIERLADACTRGGMPTTAVEDARGAQWRKVIFNASTNPIGALTGLTHGRVCERPPTTIVEQLTYTCTRCFMPISASTRRGPVGR